MLRRAKTHILQAALARGIVSGNLRHLVSCFICVLQQKRLLGLQVFIGPGFQIQPCFLLFRHKLYASHDGTPEISSGAQPILHSFFSRV